MVPQATPSTGSSPRVRGTGRHRIDDAPSSRFIPACAGNSIGARLLRRVVPVHPRVCGEQPLLAVSAVPSDGSSPRVRGTESGRPRRGGFRRFIPACAGNRLRATQRCRELPVHPRVCGEQNGTKKETAFVPGSSPRVRGTAESPRGIHLDLRFIPACAGNSLTTQRGPNAIPVHPRVCGEQVRFGVFSRIYPGSSPRVRGTALCTAPAAADIRFIPACAGNRRRFVTGSTTWTVHPRVCGEQAIWGVSGSGKTGSSPRVRGTVQPVRADPDRVRFIPACAGNRDYGGEAA